jgi:Na+/H+-dicarboxylate symporter
LASPPATTILALLLIEKGIQGPFSSRADLETIESYSEILVSIVFTFPLMGEFVPFLFILSAAWFYGNTLVEADQLKLAAIGISSLFGGTESLISIPVLLKSMCLPADAYDLSSPWASSGALSPPLPYPTMYG